MSLYSSHSSNSISTTSSTTTKSPKSRERLTCSGGMGDTSTIITTTTTGGGGGGGGGGGIAKAKMERHTKLLKTIDTASLEHLRMVLKMVCTESGVIEYALDVFTQLLDIDTKHENKEEEEEEEEIKTCRRCKKVFTTTTTTRKLEEREGEEEREEEGCRYHDGNRYVDIESEVWTKVEGVCWRDGMDMVVNCGVDWEDDPVLLEEFAEGFRWDCCDEDGGVEGCVVGGHVAG
ncbi:hypothetical protein TWF679_010876 [Orbilia oligospora]|uniref:Uncharacterized protein n=1 Tax=Orbilia oligospora TaxID=2813651 RepID=A0A8H8VIB9_ORBOL|nr:hypothetical protein TWF679_010876 [Orbilia oligospora]